PRWLARPNSVSEMWSSRQAIVVRGGGHGLSGAPSPPHSPAPMSLTAPGPGPSARLRTDQHASTGSQRYSASVSTGTSTSLSSPELLVGPARRVRSRSVAQSYCSSSVLRRWLVIMARSLYPTRCRYVPTHGRCSSSGHLLVVHDQ